MVARDAEGIGDSGAGNPGAKAWENMSSSMGAEGEDTGFSSGEGETNEQLIREFATLMQRAAKIAAQFSSELATDVEKLAGKVAGGEKGVDATKDVATRDTVGVVTESSVDVVSEDAAAEGVGDAAEVVGRESRTAAEISAKLAENGAKIRALKEEIQALGDSAVDDGGERSAGGEGLKGSSKDGEISKKIERDLKRVLQAKGKKFDDFHIEMGPLADDVEAADTAEVLDDAEAAEAAEEEKNYWIPVGTAEQLEDGGLRVNYDVPIAGKPGKFRRETETIAAEDVQGYKDDFKKWMKKTINREIASIGGMKSFLMITSERPLDSQSLWKYQIWWKNLNDTQRENVMDLMEGVDEDDKANTGGSLPWNAIRDFLGKVRDGSWEDIEDTEAARGTRAAKGAESARSTETAKGAEVRTVAEISAKLAENDAQIKEIEAQIRALKNYGESGDDKGESSARAEKKFESDVDKYNVETASFGDKMKEWVDDQEGLSQAGQEFVQTLTRPDEYFAGLSDEEFEKELRHWGGVPSPEKRQILEATIDSLEETRKESGSNEVAVSIPTMMLARIYKNGRYSLRKPGLDGNGQRVGEAELMIDDLGKGRRIQDAKEIEAELEKYRAKLFEEEAKLEVERKFFGGSDRYGIARMLSENRPYGGVVSYEEWWKKVPVWQHGEVRKFMRDLHERDVRENHGKLPWKQAMTFFGYGENEKLAA